MSITESNLSKTEKENLTVESFETDSTVRFSFFCQLSDVIKNEMMIERNRIAAGMIRQVM